MLPLLRESSAARIVNVSSGVGSLTTNADPAHPYRASCGPVYPASKVALNAITLAMMIELESTLIKVNLVSLRLQQEPRSMPACLLSVDCRVEIVANGFPTDVCRRRANIAGNRDQ
jgi:NAD(P)-dependent dehydrogenase (short-subunit alcohol dehydrogenase family)